MRELGRARRRHRGHRRPRGRRPPACTTASPRGHRQLIGGPPTDGPVTDGHALRDVLQEWAIRHVQTEMPGYFTNARTVVLGGLNHDRTTRILREFTDNIEFADPLLRLDLPARLSRQPAARARPTPRAPLAAAPAPRRGPVREVTAPGRARAPRLARAGRPGLRRRGGDLRRARRLRPRGPRRQDPHHLRHLRRAARRAGRAAASTWCSTPPRSPSTSPSTRPCSRR